MASAERTLEDAIESALESAIGGGFAVYNWADNSQEITSPCAVVSAEPRERIAPNFNFYRIAVNVSVMSHMQDDAAGTAADNAYASTVAYLQGVSAATLASASGLTVGGVAYQQGERTIEGDMRVLGAQLHVHLTIA